MAKQIKNRREDLYINDVPPEIPSGIVTNTSYATGNVAGVIKTNSTYGTSTTGQGIIVGSSRTLEQYDSNTGNLILSKGTLEAVISALITRAFVTEADPSGSASEGTKWNFSLYKQSNEYVWLVEQINP